MNYYNIVIWFTQTFFYTKTLKYLNNIYFGSDFYIFKMFPTSKILRVMGQTLSEPVTDKQSSTCQDSRYLVGSSCMQGWRVSMDDSHTHILSLPDDPGTAFFAVYDGHGGSNIAEYAGKHLHKFITARPEYHLGNIEEAMKQGFLDLDQAMLEENMQEKVAGSTAVVVLVKDNTLYCANVGDSRAVASVRGAVESLSYDHKPNNKEELERITAGGGWVQLNRVNGNLALSRALGDYIFKRNYRMSPRDQIVTAYPDVQVRQLNEEWEFIVIACDGIWEVLSNEEVISFCRVRLLSGWEPAAVCEALMQRCLAPNCLTGGIGCDNMTVVIVCLQPFPSPDMLNSLPAEQMLNDKFMTNMEDLLYVEEEEEDLK